MPAKNIGLDKLKLLEIPLFSGLDRTHLAKLVPVLEEVNYQAGEVLFQQGEFGDSLYIVVRGTVKIFITEGDETKELARLGERECFGEMSLLTGEPRSAGVQAVTELTVLRLSKDRFEELLLEHNSLAVQFAGILARRLAKVQTMPGGSADTPVAAPAPPENDLPAIEAAVATPLMKENEALPVPAREHIKSKKFWTALIGVCLSFLLYQYLGNTGLDRSQAILAAILFGATILWSLHILSPHVVALAMPILAVISGATSPEQALSGFTSPSLFTVLGFLAIAAAAAKTGLLYRLTLKLISRFPASYKGQTMGWALAGLLLTPLIPSPAVRVSQAATMLRSHAGTLRLGDGSAGSAGLVMSTLLGFGSMSYMFMNGAAVCLFVYELLLPEVKLLVTYGFWLKAALPAAIVFWVFSYAAVIIYFRHQESLRLDPAVIEDQLIILGPMTGKEKLALLAIILCVLGLATYPLHQINGVWICLVSFLIVYGSFVLDEQDIRAEIDWSYLISFGALLGFGASMSASGLNGVLVDKLNPYLQFLAGSPWLFLLAAVIFIQLLRFALPITPALLAGMLLLVPLSTAAGVNPFVTGLVLLLAGNPWFLTRQNTLLHAFLEKTEGKLFRPKQMEKLAVYYTIICLLSVTVALPFWQGMGLISQPPAGSGLSFGNAGGGEIVIGVAGSFTDSEGVSYKNAVEMAVAEINAGGGILGARIKAVFKDDQGNITRGLSIAQSFAADKEVAAVIGHRHPYISAPAAALYEQAGIILLAPASFVPPAPAGGYQYVFQSMPAAEEFGRAAARYAARQGSRRTVIYYADNQYGRSLANAFESQAGALGVEVVDRLSGYGGLKLADLLPRWQFIGFDSIYLAEALPEGLEFIAEARKAGITAPIYACSDLDTTALPLAGGEVLAGTTVFSVFNDSDPRPEVQNFITRYQHRYGVKPGMLAAQGYDAVKMLAGAIKSARSLNAGDIAAALRDMRGWSGVTGSHSFDRNGHVLGKAIVIKQVWEEN